MQFQTSHNWSFTQKLWGKWNKIMQVIYPSFEGKFSKINNYEKQNFSYLELEFALNEASIQS